MAHHRLNPEEVLSIRVGRTARQTILERGLRPRDVVALAAAAGGPKGLGLLGLDQLLFAEWLKRERPAMPRLLVGASIGAWRFAAACRTDASAALTRLQNAYVEQRYEDRPSEAVVSAECRRIVSAIDQGGVTHDRNYRLAVVTARARGPLASQYSKTRFAWAALSNARGRGRLASFFERVVFTEGALEVQPFDAFGLRSVPLTEANRTDALLASGTIPLIAAPVRNPSGAPDGLYWDGGLIDYHLAWPWQQQPGLVLYPHFVDHVVPGWLDKSFPWRRAGGRETDNLVVVAPSPKFLATLPGGHLPERQDFYRFKQNHDARIAQWREIIQRSDALADAFVLFASDPGRFAMKSFQA